MGNVFATRRLRKETTRSSAKGKTTTFIWCFGAESTDEQDSEGGDDLINNRHIIDLKDEYGTMVYQLDSTFLLPSSGFIVQLFLHIAY